MTEPQTAIIVLGAYAAVGLLAIVVVPQLQLPSLTRLPNIARRATVANELRRTVVQIVGGFGLILSLFFAWRTLTFNEEIRDAERFETIVRALGSDQSTVRFNAIYELQRLADHNPERRQQVNDYFCYWMRQESHIKAPDPTERRDEFTSVLFYMLGRDEHFSETQVRDISINLSELDLSNLKLSYINLSRANLNNTNLSNTDLQYADLREADLSGANLTSAYVVFAKTSGIQLKQSTIKNTNFQGADLTNVNLSGMVIESPNLPGVKLNGVNMSNSRIIGFMFGADLSGVDLRGADLKDLKGMTRTEYVKGTRDESTRPPSVFMPEPAGGK
jgi:uncharacterized protein YjbI with pentapeptide repeats